MFYVNNSWDNVIILSWYYVWPIQNQKRPHPQLTVINNQNFYRTPHRNLVTIICILHAKYLIETQVETVLILNTWRINPSVEFYQQKKQSKKRTIRAVGRRKEYFGKIQGSSIKESSFLLGGIYKRDKRKMLGGAKEFVTYCLTILFILDVLYIFCGFSCISSEIYRLKLPGFTVIKSTLCFHFFLCLVIKSYGGVRCYIFCTPIWCEVNSDWCRELVKYTVRPQSTRKICVFEL